MSGVVECMEPQKIAMQNTLKNFLSNWEDSVYLAAREWRVQEEANPDVLNRCSDLLSQHRREKHEVIVVDPDEVAVLDRFSYSFRKQSVRITIRDPCVLIEANFSGMVME